MHVIDCMFQVMELESKLGDAQAEIAAPVKFGEHGTKFEMLCLKPL